MNVDLAQRISWHIGTARMLGQRWGASVRRREPSQAWPAWDASPRLQEIARRHVARLAGESAELLEVLARACADAAGAEYTSPAPAPGSVSFRV